MINSRRQFVKLATSFCALGVAARSSIAQAYPSRAVNLLVGFPAGGPVDIAGRLIGRWLSARMGQMFAVQNRPGESGNIATRMAVRATPDGYSLLVCGPVHTINDSLFPTLDFNFVRDIAPVSGLYRVPLVIEVNRQVRIKTAEEFIDYAKANPGKLRVAYAGYGTPQHLGIELFKSMAGVDLDLVPFLGSAPALDALLAGNVDVMFDPMPSSIALIKSDKLRALAVTTSDRSPALPGVPAMGELLSGYEAGSWFGIGAPRMTPVDILSRLNMEITAALEDSGIRERIGALGGTTMSGSAGEFETFIAAEATRYNQVIRKAHIKPR